MSGFSTPTKDDAGKPRFDLLPPFALIQVAQVFTYGAKKYGDRNWERNEGMSFGRLFAATMRHLWRWWCGEDYDPESKLHHLAHATFGCLALLEYHDNRKGTDDRPYQEDLVLPEATDSGEAERPS